MGDSKRTINPYTFVLGTLVLSYFLLLICHDMNSITLLCSVPENLW